MAGHDVEGAKSEGSAGRVGLVLLGKTCRLCLGCETLVAHQADLDRLVGGVAGSGANPKYVVLGTLDRRVWRRGLAGRTSFTDFELNASTERS